MSRFSRLLRILRTRFLDLSFREFVNLILTSVYVREKLLIYVSDLAESPQPPIAENLASHIRKGSQQDILNGRLQHPGVWEFCCDTYDGVTDCFIFDNNGEISHISWVYYSHDVNRFLKLRAEECEVKFGITMQSSRGKGIYPAVLQVMQDYLRRAGRKKLFGVVRQDNVSSIRGLERVRFKEVGQLTFFKVLGIQLSGKKATNDLL